MKYGVKNIKDIEKLAKLFLDKVKAEKSKATIVTLSGDLGAGKTTFVQSVGKILGIKKKIVSPTFVLMKRYYLKENQFENLYHIDAYRLEGKYIKHELKLLGFEEIIKDPKNILFIEWPEILGKNLPKKVLKIKIKHKKENQREFSF
jgi:tRNA threonylcarbamoyladenosine biosynthesis protein TsaE